MAPCADDIRSEPMAEMSLRLPSRCAWQSAKPGSTERSPRSMIAASGAPERRRSDQRPEHAREMERAHPHGRRERRERVRLVGVQKNRLVRQLDAGSVAAELELVEDAMRHLRTDRRLDQLRRPGIERRDAAALQDMLELQAEEREPVVGMEHGHVRGPREPALALDLVLEAVAKADRHARIRG